MRLVDWGAPLPRAVGMGYEMDDMFPYNAGEAGCSCMRVRRGGGMG